jgi:hypothetical protein
VGGLIGILLLFIVLRSSVLTLAAVVGFVMGSLSLLRSRGYSQKTRKSARCLVIKTSVR